MSWILGWKEKLIALGLGVSLVLGYLFKVKRDAKSEGRKEVINEVNKETRKKQDEWKKIDDTPTDVDTAIRELRERARSQGR